MRLLLSLLCLLPACALAAEHPEVLFCLYERTGILYDQLYEEPPRSLECGNTTFCQKLTANYISVGDKRTHITLKGCEDIVVPHAYYGPKCQKEGCSEITTNGEKYQQCCCRGDQCNSSSILTTSLSFLFLLSILIIRS